MQQGLVDCNKYWQSITAGHSIICNAHKYEQKYKGGAADERELVECGQIPVRQRTPPTPPEATHTPPTTPHPPPTTSPTPT